MNDINQKSHSLILNLLFMGANTLLSINFFCTKNLDTKENKEEAEFQNCDYPFLQNICGTENQQQQTSYYKCTYSSQEDK